MKYELIVASLYQMPVDPMGNPMGHRPADFWGRNLLDHLISLLPELLEEDGVAYLMQISALGQLRTAELLEEAGFDARVVDYSFFHFSSAFYENIDQIHRVEELSRRVPFNVWRRGRDGDVFAGDHTSGCAGCCIRIEALESLCKRQ